jgi:prepilin-type N-terminal cleavage/methylation domain-containing protein
MRSRPMGPFRRAGFTLVELIVVATVAGVILTGVMRILISTQEVYTAQAARMESQQAVRSGLGLLYGELREVSATGGDLLDLGENQTTIRVMRTVGVACAVNYGAVNTVTAMQVGRWFRDGDSVFVFAENAPSRSSDDRWIQGQIGVVDTTAICPGGARGQILTFPDMGAVMAADSVRPGALVRAFEHVTYGLFERTGQGWFLGQRRPGGTWEPLVGPFQAPDGSSRLFRYLDAAGTATATAANVRQVEFSLRTRSPVRGPGGVPIGDSLVTRVQFRN